MAPSGISCQLVVIVVRTLHTAEYYYWLFPLLPDCTVFSGTLKLFFTEEAFRSSSDLDPVSSMFKVHVVRSNRDLPSTSGKT